MPNLSTDYVHLGPGSRADVQPPFTGLDWYMDYVERTAGDGGQGWLVSLSTFAESWDSWEVHPNGHEVVVCTAGTLTLVQEHADGSGDTVTLGVGDYVINPPGTWHTADVVGGPASALFITAGEGTQHRPR